MKKTKTNQLAPPAANSMPFPKGKIKITLPYADKEGNVEAPRLRNLIKKLKYHLNNSHVNYEEIPIEPYVVCEEEPIIHNIEEGTLREPSTESSCSIQCDLTQIERLKNHKTYDGLLATVDIYKHIFKFFEEIEVTAQKPSPTVTLMGDGLYSPQITCLKQVALESFEFGNLIEGHFFLHFKHTYENGLPRYKRPGDDEDDDYFLGVTFQFDVHDIIRVVCERKDRQGEQHYEVKLRESCIRKIILQRYNEEKMTCRMSIDLNVPPTLYKYKTDEELENLRKKSSGENLSPTERAKTKRKPFVNGSCRVTKLYDETPERVFTESTNFVMELKDVTLKDIVEIVSRLHTRHKLDVEFLRTHQSNYPTISNTLWGWPVCSAFTAFKSKMQAELQSYITQTSGKGNQGHRAHFYIVYLVTALISRGSSVTDILFSERKREAAMWTKFQQSIIDKLRTINSEGDSVRREVGYKAVVAALARLVQLVDERQRITDYSKMFERIFAQCLSAEMTIDLTEEDINQQIVLCCKLIVTPTRMIMMPPEKVMGNRVLRAYNQDESRMIRFILRDESYDKLHGMNISESMLENTVRKVIIDEVTICDKQFAFIGCSSSQMRDAGGYLIEKYAHDGHLKIPSIRRDLGSFLTLPSIMKYLARLGQCFTSSFPSKSVALDIHEYEVVRDVEREVMVEDNIVKYCFTDGIGMISESLAETLMKEYLNTETLESCPSALQFRMGGAKGMLAIEPALTNPRLWDERNASKPYTKENLKIVLRESQNKFEDVKNKRKLIPEIVKYSTPCAVTLNRPLINILDQNTAKYRDKTRDWNKGMKNRILQLLDLEIQNCAMALRDEDAALERLTDMPHRIAYRYLHECGVSFINEPFFRSLLNASAKVTFHKLFSKSQIPIPKNLGRSMLGVVDETGLLKEGQIFAQYHLSTKHRIPSANAEKRILTGRVIITKNPQITSGDVRLFEAVDIPQLYHLKDVVVFPQNGTRPHPDEMAGSDLDGDEYSVIWDPELLLKTNEKAFTFATDSHKEKLDEENITERIFEFLVTYFKLDNVGHVSINHLLTSEQYGINSKVAIDLAEKHDLAVNFSKSGVPPKPLTRNWEFVESERGKKKHIPPEISERIADFHHGKEQSPFYHSTSILGNVNRYVRRLEHIVELGENDVVANEIVLDEDYVYESKDLWSDEDALDFTGLDSQVRKMMHEYNYQLKELMEYYGIQSEAEIFSGCIVEIKNKSAQKDADELAMFSVANIIEHRMRDLFKKYREKFFEEFGGWEMCTSLPNDRRFPLDFVGDVFVRRCVRPSDHMQKKAELCYKFAYTEAKNTDGVKMLSFGWIAYDVLAYMKKKKNTNSQNTNKINFVMRLMNQHLIKAKMPPKTSIADVFKKWLNVHLLDTNVDFLLIESILNKFLSTEATLTANEVSTDLKDISPIFLKFISYLGSRDFYRQQGNEPIFMTIHKVAFEKYYNFIFNKKSLFDTDSQMLIVREHPPFTIEIWEMPEPEDGFGIDHIIDTLKGKFDIQDIIARKLPRNYRYMITVRSTLKTYKELKEVLIAPWSKTEYLKRWIWEDLARGVMAKVYENTPHQQKVNELLDRDKNRMKNMARMTSEPNDNVSNQCNQRRQNSKTHNTVSPRSPLQQRPPEFCLNSPQPRYGTPCDSSRNWQNGEQNEQRQRGNNQNYHRGGRGNGRNGN